MSDSAGGGVEMTGTLTVRDAAGNVLETRQASGPMPPVGGGGPVPVGDRGAVRPVVWLKGGTNLWAAVRVDGELVKYPVEQLEMSLVAATQLRDELIRMSVPGAGGG